MGRGQWLPVAVLLGGVMGRAQEGPRSSPLRSSRLGRVTRSGHWGSSRRGAGGGVESVCTREAPCPLVDTPEPALGEMPGT